jgi:dihydrodipicolinate synthase/N-acetylneuraminate lyase
MTILSLAGWRDELGSERTISVKQHVRGALPRGIVPLLDTPFDEKGNIDQESLVRLIEDVLRAGAGGLMAPLVASEVHALSLAEREVIVRLSVKTIQHRVPFVVGASSEKPEECRRFAALAEEVGAEAYLVAVPAALYGQPQAILGFFWSVADGIETPLIIQDLQWNGPGLDLMTIQRLRQSLPSLAGMKIETVPAGPKYTQVREAMGKDFYIAGGWALPQLIEALDRGVDAMVPESALVRVPVAIHRAHAGGRREEAVELFRQLIPVLAFSNQEIYHSIAFFKRMLVKKGIFRHPTMRPPGYSWDAYSLRIADELIEYYTELESRVAGP